MSFGCCSNLAKNKIIRKESFRGKNYNLYSKFKLAI